MPESVLQDWLPQEDSVVLPSSSVVLSSGHCVQFVAPSTSEKYPIPHLTHHSTELCRKLPAAQTARKSHGNKIPQDNLVEIRS